MDLRHLENRHDIFLPWQPDLDEISQTGTVGHADRSDKVEIETGSRILIWRTFVFRKR